MTEVMSTAEALSNDGDVSISAQPSAGLGTVKASVVFSDMNVDTQGLEYNT